MKTCMITFLTLVLSFPVLAQQTGTQAPLTSMGSRNMDCVFGEDLSGGNNISLTPELEVIGDDGQTLVEDILFDGDDFEIYVLFYQFPSFPGAVEVSFRIHIDANGDGQIDDKDPLMVHSQKVSFSERHIRSPILEVNNKEYNITCTWDHGFSTTPSP